MSDAGDAIKAAIRDEALALGFDAVGFAAAALAPDARAHLERYLAEGYHGDMGWLAARSRERAEPRALWPEARSVVVLGLSYAPEGDPRAALDARETGAISVYAQGRDYHDLVKSRLKRLAGFIAARWPGALKVFVDTAPVMEKPLAERAGIGWQGKHTNLVSRERGLVALSRRDLSRRSSCRPMRRTKIAAARAGAVSTSARPRHFRRPTGSMRGAASRT